MSPKVSLQTTKIEIKNIINDVLETVIKWTLYVPSLDNFIWAAILNFFLKIGLEWGLGLGLGLASNCPKRLGLGLDQVLMDSQDTDTKSYQKPFF